MKNVISWILRILAAVILLQTLYFKFGAHPESVALFTKLGVEPWGRIGMGIIELITGVLLLIPTTAFIGSGISSGIMGGAILFHLTILGTETNNDGGTLFGMAILVFLANLITMYLHKNQAEKLLQLIHRKKTAIS